MWTRLIGPRAGVVHVPINYALTGHELRYIVAQSGARALICDSKLEAAAHEAVGREAALVFTGSFYGGSGFDVLGLALGGDGGGGVLVDGSVDAPVEDTSVAQLLYTSGTTAAPKGAMMTHRGLIAEYLSCIVELGFGPADRLSSATGAAPQPSGEGGRSADAAGGFDSRLPRDHGRPL